MYGTYVWYIILKIVEGMQRMTFTEHWVSHYNDAISKCDNEQNEKNPNI